MLGYTYDIRGTQAREKAMQQIIFQADEHTSFVAIVADEVDTSALTPYQAAKIVSQWLGGPSGLWPHSHKGIRPQMMYNYVRNEIIAATDKRIKLEDLAEWFNRYVS
jgi:hypothetical protein